MGTLNPSSAGRGTGWGSPQGSNMMAFISSIRALEIPCWTEWSQTKARQGVQLVRRASGQSQRLSDHGLRMGWGRGNGEGVISEALLGVVSTFSRILSVPFPLMSHRMQIQVPFLQPSFLLPLQKLKAA